MKTKTYYQEKIKQLLDSVAAIDTKATSENRDQTPTELDMKNEALDKVESYKAILDTMTREEGLRQSLDTSEQPLTVAKNTKIEVGDLNATRQKFNSFGQQLAAVMNASRPGGSTDPRLFNAASGLNETVPTDGGFLVQTDFSNELLKQVWQTGKLASLCRRVPISGNANSTKMNGVDETSRATGSRYGGIRGYWAAEADEKTTSKPKFRQIELNLKKLVGLCYATDENLQDAAQLEGIIRDGFGSEFGFLIDDAIINGTGAGMPLGVLNAGCLVSQAKETGQTAATVVAENIIKMWARLFADSRPNAVWLVNQDVEPQLHQMGLTAGSGGALVYMPPGGLSGNPYATLYGRPVMAIEQCQTLGTVGDIYLADFSNGYLLAEKGGMQSDMSIHVRFIYDESVFRFVMRVDGQPVRKSALTPYKGSNTQSHFIALATRA